MRTFIALFVLYVIPLDVYTAAIGVPFSKHVLLGVPVWLLAAAAAWLMAMLHIGVLKLAIKGAADRLRHTRRTY